MGRAQVGNRRTVMENGVGRLPQTWQRHSEAGAAARAEAVVARPGPGRLDGGDCDTAPGLLAGRFPASTITSCVGTGRTAGLLRPRSPGCRFARRSGSRRAPAARSAVDCWFHQFRPCLRRGSGRRLCPEAAAVSGCSAVDLVAASRAKRSSARRGAGVPVHMQRPDRLDRI
jgi:hypothetical protein